MTRTTMKPRASLTVRIVLAVMAALLVAALAWLTVANSFDDVGFDETGFELVDAR